MVLHEAEEAGTDFFPCERGKLLPWWAVTSNRFIAPSRDPVVGFVVLGHMDDADPMNGKLAQLWQRGQFSCIILEQFCPGE